MTNFRRLQKHGANSLKVAKGVGGV